MRSPILPPGLCKAMAATRYVATSACVTVPGSWRTSREMAGTATAIIVEFSGIRDAARHAATSPRVVESAMGDGASLEQVDRAATERELDVVPGGSEYA